MITSQTIKDIAKRGLNLDHEMEQILIGIWNDFEEVEPNFAKVLSESFGSAEYAALMIIGQFNGRSSILDELSNKTLTKNHIDELLAMSPEFIDQTRKGVMELD